jgi:hypothetical protein
MPRWMNRYISEPRKGYEANLCISRITHSFNVDPEEENACGTEVDIKILREMTLIEGKLVQHQTRMKVHDIYSYKDLCCPVKNDH